jgi:hypothetical protein
VITDSFEVREYEAWYKEGANTLSMYSGAATLAIGCIMSLVCMLWPVEPYIAAVITALSCGSGIAGSTGLVILNARKAARRRNVRADLF